MPQVTHTFPSYTRITTLYSNPQTNPTPSHHTTASMSNLHVPALTPPPLTVIHTSTQHRLQTQSPSSTHTVQMCAHRHTLTCTLLELQPCTLPPNPFHRSCYTLSCSNGHHSLFSSIPFCTREYASNVKRLS